MAFYEHATEFAGKQVVDYQAGQAADPATTIYRLRVEYDAEQTATDLLMELLEEPEADQITGLVIGAWSGELNETQPTEILEALVAAAGQLPSLTALFVGDIIVEENEISWIQQSDVSPLWAAFPKLENLQIRGGNGLSLGKLKHDHLKRLVIETGGLPVSVLRELAAAKLPALEHLELYLGTDGYGWDGTVKDVEPLLTGKLFPKLQYLGLRNSEIADEVAVAVAKSPLISRIKVLDLSLGTLTDIGAQALLESPARLQRLNLAHHYLTDAMIAKFKSLTIPVDLSDPQGGSGDDDDRYVAVGE